MRLGAHISVAGGISLAFDRAIEVTAQCMQIFSRNQRQWQPRPLDPVEAERFRRRQAETGIGPNMSHASYLVNLATGDPELAAKSVAAMVDEVQRADLLGLDFVVFHPGSTPDGLDVGIARVGERLDRIIELAGPESRATILLENTAGQGNALGVEFGHLRDLLAASRRSERLGICIDTCHAFAAGHRYDSEEAYEQLIRVLHDTVTLERIRAFHVNDSLRHFGSRKDRHAGIGEGEIGVASLAWWLNDVRFSHHPATLETPEAEAGYKRELALLRAVVR